MFIKQIAFEIGVPDRIERAAILKVILNDESAKDNIDLDPIAALSEVYTVSNILELCKKASYFRIRDLLNEEKKGKPIKMCTNCFSLQVDFLLPILNENNKLSRIGQEKAYHGQS